VPEQREIDRIVGEDAGPTLVVIGGMHGNEPGGARAAKRVLEMLGSRGVRVRGEVLALAGNLAALRAGRRYHVKDLNRQWTDERVATLLAQPEERDDAEDREQRALLLAITSAIARARGKVVVADLHTTSAPGIPFYITGDTLPQRKLAMAFPLPIVLGLEEQLDGALSEHWTRHACMTFAVEGGQHDDPASIDNLEAVILVALAATGVVDERDLRGDVADAQALLAQRRSGLPHVMEVVERHAIREEDRFTMMPGFRNLDRARAGQLLARDARGEIRAPRDGMVILPLYQASGDDGFFWGREVSTLRLGVSETLRRLGVGNALGWLPGVHRDAEQPSRLLVGARASNLVPLGLFQLLGYRRVRPHEGGMAIDGKASDLELTGRRSSAGTPARSRP
jgi:succinylglutamate desuccinylase